MLNFFTGLLRKRGEHFFCHPLLWGALAPPPSSYAPGLREACEIGTLQTAVNSIKARLV